MNEWRGLLVLTIGLVIGAGLWLGVANLASHGAAPRMALATQGVGVTGAARATEDEESKPFRIAQRAGELQSLLEDAPYIRRGITGPALYVETFRTCPACAEFKDNEWAGLEAAGVDIRWLVYARRDHGAQARSQAPERAVVAELALNRSYQLLDAWFRVHTADEFYRVAQMPPSAESSPERSAALDKTRTLVDSLSAITAANGEEMAIPAFFWHATDGWYAMIGYDEEPFAAVKAALMQPGAAPPAPAAPTTP